MASQLRSQRSVKSIRYVALILTCLLLSQAQVPAVEGAQRRRSETRRGRTSQAPRKRLNAQLPPQQTRPLTKDLLIDTLMIGRDPAKRMTLEDFLERIQKRGVKFRVTPADERDIRKAGEYLTVADFRTLVEALRLANYRPATPLSGTIEQVKVMSNPGGGTQVFIQLTVRNNGPQSIAESYTLRVMKANSAGLEFELNGGKAADMQQPFPMTEDGKAGEVAIRPEDSLVQKTRQAIKKGQPVTGWLRFNLMKVPLKPETLRQRGFWYVVSFVDVAGEPYEAVYEMN